MSPVPRQTRSSITFCKWLQIPRGEVAPSEGDYDLKKDLTADGRHPLLLWVDEDERRASHAFATEQAGEAAYQRILLERSLRWLFEDEDSPWAHVPVRPCGRKFPQYIIAI